VKPVKNILTATDLSDASSHAVERGFELAKNCNAHFSIIYTLGMNTFLFPLRRLLGQNTARMTRKVLYEQMTAFQNIADKSAQNPETRSSLQLAPGLVLSTIPRFAEAVNADMILIGFCTQSIIHRLTIGFTVTHLLRKRKAPILIVKTPCAGAYKKILIPVDFSPIAEPAIRMAKEMAPEADIVLLNIFGVPFEGMLRRAGVADDLICQYRAEAKKRATLQICKLAHQAGLSSADFSVAIEHGDAAEIILEQASYYNSDLIVMGKQRTHLAEELLLRSVTKKVISDANADILVVADRHSTASS